MNGKLTLPTVRNVVPIQDGATRTLDVHCDGLVIEIADEADALRLLAGLVKAYPFEARDAVGRRGKYASERAS